MTLQKSDHRNLNEILYDVGEWAHQTFPQWTVHSILEHVRRELDEIEADPDNAHEHADVLILLAHLWFEKDINIASAVVEKHAINVTRTWAPPDADGVVEHVR